MSNIDWMLAQCGDFNRYQFLLMSLFCIINVLSAMQYYSQTIISFVPHHWCISQATANWTLEQYKNASTSACSIATDSQNDADTDIATNSNSGQQSPYISGKCKNWIFELDYGYESMTSDLNWVCQYSWKSATGQSMFFIGSVLGTFLFGIIADKIGRLPVLIIAHIISAIGNGITIFSTNEIIFSVARFIAGFSTDSNFVMMYILVMEYTRASKRTFSLNLCIGVFYCLGSMITPWIAVALGTWKLFLLAISIPTLIIPSFYFLIHESAEWLIANNKTENALKNFQKIAKFNRIPLPKETINAFKQNCAVNTTQENSPSILGLFRTPRLRRNTLILFFKSMVITLCYDAISKNVEGLGVSPFVMFTLSATAIFPACLVLLFLQDKIGRKAMASSSLLVSGIFTIFMGIIISESKHIKSPVALIISTVIARFGVTVAYNSGAQYAAELIPTCVRAQGVSCAHLAGYALTFFSSYILYLGNYWKVLPPIILGILSFSGAFFCLLLPETLNKSTPITLEDGEKFGLGEKMFSFSCSSETKTTSTITLTEFMSSNHI